MQQDRKIPHFNKDIRLRTDDENKNTNTNRRVSW